MKTAHKLKVLVLTALIVFAASPALAKDEWLQVKSKNFEIIGNADEKELRRVAGKLEQFREAFRQLLPNLKFTSPVPTTVVVFKNGKSFDPFKPVDQSGKPNEWIAGYFLKGEDINYIALSTEGEKEQTYSTIFHEYTHFLIDNAVGRGKIPPWLNEGLAEYYEKLRIEDDRKVTVGLINNNHLALLSRGGLLPLDKLFNTDYYSLNSQEARRVGIFYAQSWAFIHYLLHADNGVRRKQFNNFFKLIINGKVPKDAFAEAFNTDYGTMLADLIAYVGQRRFTGIAVNLNEKLVFEKDMVTSPLDEADSKATLGDLLLHARRLDEAEPLLRQALALKPNSVQANISLGLVRMRKRDSVEAKKFLKRAIELDDKSWLAHFQYAYALSREGMSDEGFVTRYDTDIAAEIKSELKKAIALNPNFAESYNLYAFVSSIRNEDIDEALLFIKKALEVSPGNQRYLIRAAEVLLRKEDFTQARTIAQKVFDTASDARMRLYAQNTLARINSTEAQLNAIKNPPIDKPNLEGISDKPLSEEEIAQRNREATNEGLNQSLRKLRAGERRILGFITKIECAAGRIEFTVNSSGHALKFLAKDFESLFLMSFSPDSAETELGCGTIEKDVFAVVTYLPASKTGSNGEIVAVEFMPEGFKLM